MFEVFENGFDVKGLRFGKKGLKSKVWHITKKGLRLMVSKIEPLPWININYGEFRVSLGLGVGGWGIWGLKFGVWDQIFH
jgi:hypothetical protein